MFRRLLFPTAVTLALLVVACGGSADTTTSQAASTSSTAAAATTEYSSADGSATVSVASDAAPATIESIDPADLGLPADFESFGAYELGPDGFDGGAIVTVDTGQTWGDGNLQLPIGLLSNDDGEWEVLETASVSEIGGEITVAFDVPHFSVLLIARAPWAIDIDPWSVVGSVGERWEAYWDILDPGLARIANTRPIRTYAFPDDSWPVRGDVRELLDEVEVQAVSRADGVVSHEPSQEHLIGTYDLHLADGFSMRDTAANQYVEVFYGSDVFTCLSPGRGVFGFSVAVHVDRPDLVFAQRYGNRMVVARPSGGIVFRYDIAAPATCRDHNHIITSRIARNYLEFDERQSISLLDNMQMDVRPGGIYSIMGVEPGLFQPRIDLWDVGGYRYEEKTQLGIDLKYNFSIFGCGDSHISEELGGIKVRTVCPQDAVEVQPGGMILVAAEYMDALPAEGATDHYTYAVVFDSNGDPADDWQFQGQFDWDFFQGADRWYQLDWDPDAQEWEMRVSNNLDAFGPSGARAVLAGNTILWLVPASEFDSESPTYRVTSFVHDGTFQAEVSGGDVSGDDPTQPLFPVVDLRP